MQVNAFAVIWNSRVATKVVPVFHAGWRVSDNPKARLAQMRRCQLRYRSEGHWQGTCYGYSSRREV